MNKWITPAIAVLVLCAIAIPPASAAIVDPTSPGMWDETRINNYDRLMSDLASEDRVIQRMDGNRMWVPWYTSATSCEISDLHRGSSCNSGKTIDYENNCMVTDEFSQVGILASMGSNQELMDGFVNTVREIASTNGKLPAWRVYRNGNSIEACKEGINGNCDTASDASARIISALYTAGENPRFSNEAKRQEYLQLARELTDDFIEFEIVHECKPTTLGEEACYWLAGGSNAKRGGLESNHFVYTGYFADAAIALLQACSVTGEGKYCEIADDLALNYLAASYPPGTSMAANGFRAPPGMAFKWVDTANTPRAECTQSCSPLEWDGADAPRALGMCQALYYADMIDHDMPQLEQYCQLWTQRHGQDPTRMSLQYRPDGSAKEPQQGFFAQGLQALFYTGADEGLYRQALDSALAHYSTSTKTWDWTSCFGVYTAAFPIRALGVGAGLDVASFDSAAPYIPNEPTTQEPTQELADLQPTTQTCSSVGELSASCNFPGGCTLVEDTIIGSCRVLRWNTNKGPVQILACEKSNTQAEVYRQQYPSHKQFKACIGNGCVDDNSGFAVTSIEQCSVVVEQPPLAQEPEPSPIVYEPAEPTQEPIVENTASKVATLPYLCEATGGCTTIEDTTIGVCRTVISKTNSGTIQVLACEKDGGAVEVYRQQMPSSPFKACFATGCVNEYYGFARITP